MCAQFATERLDRDAVDEGALARDLENRQPLAVRRLELVDAGDVDLVEGDALRVERLACDLAKVAAATDVENDASGYG